MGWNTWNNNIKILMKSSSFSPHGISWNQTVFISPLFFSLLRLLSNFCLSFFPFCCPTYFPRLVWLSCLFPDLQFYTLWTLFFIGVTSLRHPGRFCMKCFDIFPLMFCSKTGWHSKLLDQKKESSIWSPVSNKSTGSV